MELKNTITPEENSRILINRVNQAEDRMSGFKGKVDNLDDLTKEYSIV